ncbi:AzlD domain-containing protein [Candidatus Pelagibacter sp.]|nr:AzlD domain-containing protein [Candidatus Pelagibacter sp.]
MSISIVLAILVTSLATFSSRFLGVVSSKGIKETSKIFRWFNCLAYSTLAALIARTIIFPVGVLSDTTYLSRVTVVLFCLFIFFISKKNFVYPTVISAILMSLLSEYL